MIPRILEYEEGMIKITAEAWTIPETHAIIKKFGDGGSEPYLAYVYMMSYPDTPYKNLPEDERIEAVVYDVKNTHGDFDENEDLIGPAIERLTTLWQSPQTLLADEMEEELHRWRKWLRENPLQAGLDGNMKDRLSFIDKIDKISQSAANIRKIADDEIGTKMKGDNELGEY